MTADPRAITDVASVYSDATLTFKVELIEEAGFPAEEHYTVTEDGYLIVLHRIPPPQPTGRVFIYFHGFFCSSIDIVLRGREKGLAFLLSEVGFDVWLPNYRGVTDYPITVNTSVPKPWDFSWEEQAKYDFPAIMDYVLTTTGVEKVSTLGVSMAGNIIIAGLTYHPHFNQRLNVAVFLAPSVRMKYLEMKSMKMASSHWPLIQKLCQDTKIDYLPIFNLSRMHKFMNSFCSNEGIGYFLCASILYSAENSYFNIEKELLPVIFKHYPTPGSIKTVLHYFQMIETGRFSPFDYGKEENLRRYNQTSPPDYDLSKVTAPVAIFYSKYDAMVSSKDSEWLISQLRNNTVLSFCVKKHKFAHISFMWDPNLKSLVYDTVIPFLLSF